MEGGRRRISHLVIVLLVVVVAVTGGTKKEKRQIYREAVLPGNGGVIPEGAFSRQRLQHNVNDQLGVQAPDGLVFIPRNFDNRYGVLDPEDEREILRVKPFDLNTLTHGNGLVHHTRPLATTYLLRRPTQGQLFARSGPHFRPSPSRPPFYPQVFPYGRGVRRF